MSDMVLVFTKQLYALIKSGVPLLKALQIISSQVAQGTKFKHKLEAVIQQIQEGKNFSEALSSSGEFSIFYVDMVKAAELSGNLTGVLKELNTHFALSRRINQQVRAALMYPIFVLCTAVIILVVLMLFVLPVFFKIFEDLGVSMPATTLILIGMSKFMVKWSWLALVLAALTAIALFLFSKKPAGRRFINQFKWNLPLFGSIIKNTEVARFCRTLGTLLSSGVALMKSLDALVETTPTILLRDAIQSAKDRVEAGEAFSSAVEDSRIFPVGLVKMIQVGEESGKFADILLDVAQDMEEESYYKITGLLSLLEPALIVAMGAFVGFVVIALFLPIFTMGGLVK